MGRPRHPDRPERWFGATTVVAMAVAASCRGRRPDVEGGVAPPLRLDTASAAAAATVPVGLPADGGVGLDASPGGGYWVVASAIGATSAILTAEVDQDRLPPAYGGQPGAVSAERRIDGGWSNEDVNDRWEARPRGWRDTVEVRANPDSDETYRVAVDFSRAHLPGGVVYSTPIRLHAPEAPTAPPTPARDLRGRPVSPYAAVLNWTSSRDGSNAPYGFEVILLRDDASPGRPNSASGSRYPGRVAIVRPDLREVTIHGLLPGTRYEFGVRAFNPRGVSPLADRAEVRTPSGDTRRGDAGRLFRSIAGVSETWCSRPSAGSRLRRADDAVLPAHVRARASRSPGVVSSLRRSRIACGGTHELRAPPPCLRRAESPSCRLAAGL
jgi:hypothetical protein